MERLYPGRRLVEIGDDTLHLAYPPEGHAYAACFPSLTVVCTQDVALDLPSHLGTTFRAEARGRTLHLHTMLSSVDWFAYAIWDTDGALRRALSLSSDDGILENTGNPLDFEADYWAGKHPVEIDEDDPDLSYPLPFHPLDLAEDALRALFGFVFEGEPGDGDAHLDEITLAGYRLDHPGR
ncbi:conserved hypothetical protein [Frankia canadensis]|uniref:Uncharacterized protein n=1 Tax=Frankia canadensis TaxID=1836972 RepID=A0A2I2KUB6_9ACTN|nr:hypothetical protein [Frankia canadensis]SNQ49256.1 conserved hypothetical protein [Frankia canadensis]SOU56546.1 conserved hypothetical protein [Frankia canadensis]